MTSRDYEGLSGGSAPSNRLGRGAARIIASGVVVVLVMSVLLSFAEPALAHGNLPTHSVSGACYGAGGTYAVHANPIDIDPDYRAGLVVGTGLKYEQFVGFQIVIAWQDATGAWQYRYGNPVAGRNGDFTAESGNSFVLVDGVWQETSVQFTDTMFWTGGDGYSPQSIAYPLSGPGTYWVTAKITWYPLNIVDTSYKVVENVYGSSTHWMNWTKVACYEGSYNSMLNAYGYFVLQ